MIAYITIGVDDMARAKQFYTAFLPALGYGVKETSAGLEFALPTQPGQAVVQPEIYIKPPFDGQAASAGNGTMLAFDARNQQRVRELHAAALAAGGTDEGPPGFRERYGPRFFVAYVRDPQGNKVALFSSNPAEPGRDG